MRFRLLRRRLTVSAPRMAIRSALPWPLRWALVALMLGFSAAIGLWAFEFGKSIAGLDKQSKLELQQLRAEVGQLRSEVDKNRTQINVADSLMVAEKAEKDSLKGHLKKLELDNQALRDDLGFFQKLTAGNNVTGISLRGLSAEMHGPGQLQWQTLLMQPVKNAPEFQGRLEITLSGTKAGKLWTLSTQEGGTPVTLKQYLRQQGVVDLPPQVVVTSITAKLLQGSAVKAVLSSRVL